MLHLAGIAQTEERVAYVRGLLGDRADAVELNIMVQQVIPPSERATIPDRFAPLPPDAAHSPEDLPSVLIGTPAEMAQQLKERRERYGITYFTVMEYNMENFAPVIAALR